TSTAADESSREAHQVFLVRSVDQTQVPMTQRLSGPGHNGPPPSGRRFASTATSRVARRRENHASGATCRDDPDILENPLPSRCPQRGDRPCSQATRNKHW